LAVTLALGGDCLADIALLRAEPDVYGLVASDPTVSRAIDRLAHDAVAALRAINTARAAARARVWEFDKEGAAPTFSCSITTRCGASATTAPPAAGSRCRSYCAPGTPARTPPKTTSPSSARHCVSCPATALLCARAARS